MERERWDRWYLRAAACLIAFLCGFGILNYAWAATVEGAIIPVLPALLCLGFFGAGVLYLVRPRQGHHLLVGLSIIALLASARSLPPAATAFWIYLLILLMIPVLSRRRSHPNSATLSPLAATAK